MAHQSWIEADAHISWEYDQAGTEDRLPAVLGGDNNPGQSAHLAGYEYEGEVLSRVQDLAAESGTNSRWPAIYEMGRVIVGFERLSNMQRLADVGIISTKSVARLTPEDLQP